MASLICRRSACVLAALLTAVRGEYKLPPLPYDYDALEPYIDKQTMMIHHDKHHAAYVAGLNAALKDNDQGGDAQLPALMKKAMSLGTPVRNHGGGHYNHAFFWVNMINPVAAGESQPSGKLAAAITASFGDMDGLKTSFNNAAMTRFGSGWAWLGVDPTGQLAITSSPNQDNPLMDGSMIPILGLDVWEHAYYLKYTNKRADYVSAFWNVVNWVKVSRNYEMYAIKNEVVPPTTTGGGHAIEL